MNFLRSLQEIRCLSQALPNGIRSPLLLSPKTVKHPGAFASPGTGRKKAQPRRFFRPVPWLRRDRPSPSAGALGYCLSPCGLGRMKIVAAREENHGLTTSTASSWQAWRHMSQRVQSRSSTSCLSYGRYAMAPTGQACAHSVHPMQLEFTR